MLPARCLLGSVALTLACMVAARPIANGIAAADAAPQAQRVDRAAAGLRRIAASAPGQEGRNSTGRRIAVTVDDLPTTSVLGNDLGAAERTTRELLAVFSRHQIPAIGFVNESRLYTSGRIDPKRVALLQQWIDAGLELGNHTYSHPDLHSTPVEQFERDVIEGEKVTRSLLEKTGRSLRYFRHPFLHTGRSSEVRMRVEGFLATRGYSVAPVTVDNYDYVFAAAYDRAGERGDAVARLKIADEYIRYMRAVVEYYEQQSAAIIGREIAQTLLIHANALNADTFSRLASWLEMRGYRFVSLGEALRDPAYRSPDGYFGPAGITWLHRWALTAGRGGDVFAGEPTVPEWIERASSGK